MNPHDERAVVQREGFSELVVRAATVCTKIVQENCGLCTIYCDKQVQYESVLEQYTAVNPLGELFSKLDNGREVETFRNQLFDEDSVVEQVASRDAGDM
mmetsp:Transcript_27293/g.41956  ORF Transcript_27293/g.41956 Transcript_27293/m.41956 type:complete len:99 (-) Transcript_27293:248-544(-)|eukprot:CAMPEP_0117011596 /NCGR_PEP_ID=MMETSP0472-20121206/9941_1 /TAXON_ID=693140 ORGANISM="Tiarina fusus, Strain LIS" /NCGR_SAMPLE_ID=MMETSP0472 /ASSEMBLY_ACC=CAM_ASM_000603 /LENGTH=98 /DNA_ID=CAMNT_0004714453 /DNA_START=151 /DNA_END=447 /DNA_ORIENTATION=+